MNGIQRRELLAAGIGVGAGITLGAGRMPVFAQEAGEGGRAKKIPHRTATTTKLFKAPDYYPNALAVTADGVWIGQQKEEGKAAVRAKAPPQTGPEHAWLLDWTGKVKKDFTLSPINTSGMAVGGGYVWMLGNGAGTDGAYMLDINTGKLAGRRDVPLGGGGCHGGQWAGDKLWLVANRLSCMIRVDPKSWNVEYAIPIYHDTPDTLRWHDMTIDADGNVWIITGNDSKNYATGKAGLAKYDGKTGEVLELVSLVPGSCDPHGLGVHDGKFVSCDAGHHPGWPDKDGPSAGWIFTIDMA